MLSQTAESDIRDRFRELRDDWKARSQFLSNTAQMAILWPYQQIIGLGRAAVPLILAELRREPDQWFWALEAITGENPVPEDAAGDVARMAEAWIDWGEKQGLAPDAPLR